MSYIKTMVSLVFPRFMIQTDNLRELMKTWNWVLNCKAD